MKICFWNLCYCPDATPCAEHSGFGCSNLNGKNITKESDVSDALSGAITVALSTMLGEKAAAEQARKQMEDRRTELEKDQHDLETLINNATDRTGRRAVRDKYEQLYQKHKNTISDLGDALNRYESIVQYPIGQIGSTLPKLAIPFSDATGYCACYQEKQKRLAALAGALAAEQANCATMNAELIALRQNARKYWKYANTLVVTAGGALAWWLYIYMGISFFSLQTLLILIGVAVILAGMIAYLLYKEHAIAASQILILQLLLHYYQLQSIPTCQKPGTAAPVGGDDSWWGDLKKLIKDAVASSPKLIPK